jgi:ABC-2 type transport system ATP-binding protein
MNTDEHRSETALNAIVATGLTKQFKDTPALDGVSFQLGEGEVAGLVGPNGSGKSTLLRILATVLEPSGGSASILGHDLLGAPNEVRRLIGYVPQSITSDPDLTLEENLRFFAGLHNLSWKGTREYAQQLLRSLGLDGRASHLTRTLSLGLRRRLEVARGLLHQPRLLLLDEPSAGLDEASRKELISLLRQIHEQHRPAMLISTHHREDLAGLSTRFVRLEAGRAVEL